MVEGPGRCSEFILGELKVSGPSTGRWDVPTGSGHSSKVVGRAQNGFDFSRRSSGSRRLFEKPWNVQGVTLELRGQFLLGLTQQQDQQQHSGPFDPHLQPAIRGIPRHAVPSTRRALAAARLRRGTPMTLRRAMRSCPKGLDEPNTFDSENIEEIWVWCLER